MAIRYFALRTSQAGNEDAVFTGRQPRQAALKAASRGFTDIFLRERGSKKLHHFRGSRSKVRAPTNKPEWMPEMVWKPNVRKSGVVHLERRSARSARRARRSARRARRTARRARRR
ncbi:chromosomal protein MC1 [Candidatus Micrarchaeota archaeon]|nr:chromosomal protein MC1 [Candidatus Micrarchaeota archaeon]